MDQKLKGMLCMSVGETIEEGKYYTILRVPGGWIYRGKKKVFDDYGDVAWAAMSDTFVPEPDPSTFL